MPPDMAIALRRANAWRTAMREAVPLAAAGGSGQRVAGRFSPSTGD